MGHLFEGVFRIFDLPYLFDKSFHFLYLLLFYKFIMRLYFLFE
jgi:hypothetical protein